MFIRFINCVENIKAMIRLFIILDGLGDRPLKELGGKTPLEYAHTPNLDYFADKGASGYVYTINSRIAPESDEAVWALLGNDPMKGYPGRGPIEAYGSKMKFEDGNVCLRANFATVNGKKIKDRRVGRSLTSKEAHALSKVINKKVKLRVPFEFKATIAHRGILVLKDKLSDKISNTDPAYKKVGHLGVAREGNNFEIKICKPLSRTKLSLKTSNIVNDFVKQSKAILEKHPINKRRKKNGEYVANYILLRDSGNFMPKVKHALRGWGAVVAMPLEQGIAKIMGLDILDFNYPKGKDKDRYKALYAGLNKTMKVSLQYIKKKEYPYYYLHFKETDLPGHDGRFKDKIKMIEMIDKKFFGALKKMKDVEFVVTADHSTPCSLKSHSADPVPLLVYVGGKRDHVSYFGESYCKKGSIGKVLGKNLLKKIGYI
jgi:2,3-bisphosphoglycerate-independent phosphoglycerate mutase